MRKVGTRSGLKKSICVRVVLYVRGLRDATPSLSAICKMRPSVHGSLQQSTGSNDWRHRSLSLTADELEFLRLAARLMRWCLLWRFCRYLSTPINSHQHECFLGLAHVILGIMRHWRANSRFGCVHSTCSLNTSYTSLLTRDFLTTTRPCPRTRTTLW